MSFLRSVPALLRRFLCSSLVVRCCSSPRPRSLQLEEMMWASVRRKVLSGSSTTYLVLEQSLPGTCFMAPLSRSYSNPLKVVIMLDVFGSLCILCLVCLLHFCIMACIMCNVNSC
ncbi:hypothetical protein MANES_17G014150v8 [Manihot esculenta]|uniref:Uncharacterized protein n=1 Tax=Manihot esculenta TaxID=3983 RepID=A0ACB7G5Y5_MANES|nr:hypothetical protein MANES_17G014150v8 [Manihot esculenta]